MSKAKTESAPRRRGRPRSQTEPAVRALYFRDAAEVEAVEAQLLKHPRSSLSAVVQQMVGAFRRAYDESQSPVDGKVTLQLSVYL